MRRLWLVGGMVAGLALSVSSSLAQDDPAATPTAGTEAPATQESAPAQETAAEDSTAPAEGSFEALYLKWNELTAEAKSKAAEFTAAAEADKDAIRTAYNDVVTQLEALLPELKKAAVARYTEMEAPDEELTKLLLGLMINDAAAGKPDDVLDLAQKLIDKRAPRELLVRAASAPRLGLFNGEVMQEVLVRYDEAVADDLPRVKITTAKGEVVVELFENEAPNTVANFISLVEKGGYNGSSFHRVLDQFMAQGGAQNPDGTGSPGYTIACECYEPSYRRHFRGSLAMAHAGRDTGGSQFYLVMTAARTKHLDGRHTVFGRIVSGIEVLDLLTRRDPSMPNQPEVGDTIVSMEVLRKREHEYTPVTKPDPDAGN